MFKKYFLLIFFALIAICGCKKTKLFIHNASQDFKTKKVTIWVHGTKTITGLIPKYFYVPKGLNKSLTIDRRYYIREMNEILCSINPSEFVLDDFYTFGWSGGLGNNYRIEAATHLYYAIIDLINKYKNNGKDIELTIITHSHGGNVALNLAKIAENCQDKFKIDKLILLACPVQDETKNLISSDMFKKVYSIYSKLDFLQIMDPQGLQKENKNKKVSFFSKRRFIPCEKLKQVKVKINHRAIMHVEFLSRKFLKILPSLLSQMDCLTCDQNERLIKIDFINDSIQNIAVI